MTKDIKECKNECCDLVRGGSQLVLVILLYFILYPKCLAWEKSCHFLLTQAQRFNQKWVRATHWRVIQMIIYQSDRHLQVFIRLVKLTPLC